MRGFKIKRKPSAQAEIPAQEAKEGVGEDTLDLTFIDKLQNLNFTYSLKLSEGVTGNRKSNAKGNSIEFSDYREYILGDDFRKIDWNAYGRTKKLYVKQFMEEKEGIYHILLDTSSSMRFGEVPKSTHARLLAAAFSYIILCNQDRVCIDELREHSVLSHAGVTGRASFPTILHHLNHMQYGGQTTLLESIRQCKFPSGGVSIVISDFLEEGNLEDMVRFLAFHKQTILLIQVLAKEEREQTDILDGCIDFIDMETSLHQQVTMSKTALDSYQNRFKEHQKKLLGYARKYHCIYFPVYTDEEIGTLLQNGCHGVLSKKI